MRKKPIPYTAEENEILLKYIKLYPTNLRQAFRLAAMELPRRSEKSCHNRWYLGLRNNPALVVSTGSVTGFTHNVKNVPVDKNGNMPDQGLTEGQTLLKMILNASPQARAFALSSFGVTKVKRDTVRVSSTSTKNRP